MTKVDANTTEGRLVSEVHEVAAWKLLYLVIILVVQNLFLKGRRPHFYFYLFHVITFK